MDKKNDPRAIHAIGNGNFLVYGIGPDIINIFGPDYTSASFGTICCRQQDPFVTRRIAGTNRWQHTLQRNGAATVLEDAMDPGQNLFVRKVRADFACDLKMIPNPQALYRLRPDYAPAGMQAAEYILPAGTTVFHTDTSRTERRLILLAAGCVQLTADGLGIKILPGEGMLVLAAAKPQQMEQTLALLREQPDVVARDAAFWQAFLARGAAVRERVPKDHREYVRIMAALEDVAIQIKAQQSFDGGVMAGHYYQLGYVRDQAGVLRGLLAMGYYEEARKILEFRYNKWKRFGDMPNAEAMGNEEARLYFTNDEVEVPAYVVLGAFDYLRATGDAAYVKSIFAMVAWCIRVQLKHLYHGMTGFSGDETYIAGFIFPRPFLYHGSAESTFLFIEGTKLALDFDAQHDLLTEEDRSAFAQAVSEAQSLYRENFVTDGVIYSNNPARERYAPAPRFHYGWCQADELNGTPGHLTWLERGGDGIYRCPYCTGKPAKLPCAPDKRFLLGSVNLLLAYFGTTLFAKEELAANAAPYIDAFVRTGYVGSELGGEKSLGYDFGLFLYNMAYLDSPYTERILSLTLDMTDRCGMWAEYYKNGEPYNCRCRPWESAINIEAILYAVLKD